MLRDNGPDPYSEPYAIDCPLCGHGQQVASSTGGMCQYCGAQLDVFDDPTAANQYAEECKARTESARWAKVLNDDYWVVAHKAPPIDSGIGYKAA